MDDVYYVVPGPEDRVDGEDAEPKVYVSTTQGLKKVIERRHSQNSDRFIFHSYPFLSFVFVFLFETDTEIQMPFGLFHMQNLEVFNIYLYNFYKIFYFFN